MTLYVGIDACEPHGIYLNDSAPEPRLTRTHLSDDEARVLIVQLERALDRRTQQKINREDTP